MKLLKRILKILAAIVVLIAIIVGGIIYSSKPKYSGEITLEGALEEVEVIYDEFGVPHIYAKNEHDAYLTLGYVHAQDRLFQMEIMRRVGGGRLAEILGPNLIETDKFFKTIGIEDAADESVEMFMENWDKPWHHSAMAYLDGINHFLKNGPTPLEYTLLGIQKEDFTPKDVYLIIGYMSFSFAQGFRTDPMMTKIYRDLGPEYLNDLVPHWVPGDEMIQNYKVPDSSITDVIAIKTIEIIDNLPAPVLIGSNSWVLSGNKTKSGKVMFANDTHIGYAQPSIWYEAHIEYPGFSYYANHLAGFPNGLVGHTRTASIGLTMFENDDVDFFVEKVNPDDPNQVWEDDHWQDMRTLEKTIKVKGQDDVNFKVQITRHGPLINSVIEDAAKLETSPVSVWWSFTKVPNNTVRSSYAFGHLKTMDEAREAAYNIYAPGLNVMYGDADGNIAWWAAAKLVKRPRHVHSKLFLDGASGADEYEGWFEPEENPQAENPPCGFVYSANNQPDTIYSKLDSGLGTLYPGYYVPEERAVRIMEYMKKEQKWDVEAMKNMSTDVTAPSYARMATYIMAVIENERMLDNSSTHAKAVNILKAWKGGHEIDEVAPTIYNKLLYNILYNAMVDEIGEGALNALLTTHFMKRSIFALINKESSVWWDDIDTQENKETRKANFIDAFDRTIRELENQLGPDVAEWKWGRVHTVEYIHPVGRQEPFDKIFNVGPMPIKGSNEVLNNTGFSLNGSGEYKVIYGPAMRIVMDFSDIENAISILPTGQSGNVMSDHYDDQAEMYAAGAFRKMRMNREEIVLNQIGTLFIKPKK